MDYYQKYLKYKNKYSQLKEMIGGAKSPWNCKTTVALFIGLDIDETSSLGKNIKDRLIATKKIMATNPKFAPMIAEDSGHSAHMTLFTLTAPIESPFAHFLNYYFKNPINQNDFEEYIHELFLTYFDNAQLQAYSAMDEYELFVDKFIARRYDTLFFPNEKIFRTNVGDFKNEIVDYLLAKFINLSSIDKSVLSAVFEQETITNPVTAKDHVHWKCKQTNVITKNKVYKSVIDGRRHPLAPDTLFQIDDMFSKEKFLPHVSIFGTKTPVITNELYEEFKDIFKSVGVGKPISYINLYSNKKTYFFPEYTSGSIPTGKTKAIKGSLKSIDISFSGFKPKDGSSSLKDMTREL
jgi:hypothetical protein